MDGIPVAQIEVENGAEKISYIHTDHLDTPRFATSSLGDLSWRWLGDGFGAQLPDQDPGNSGVPTTINLRFPGQYYYAETGFHYNGFRYYSPTIGRYTQSDPIGIEAGINTYGYVKANPLLYVDPEGLKGARRNASGTGRRGTAGAAGARARAKANRLNIRKRKLEAALGQLAASQRQERQKLEQSLKGIAKELDQLNDWLNDPANDSFFPMKCSRLICPEDFLLNRDNGGNSGVRVGGQSCFFVPPAFRNLPKMSPSRKNRGDCLCAEWGTIGFNTAN